MKVTVVTPAPAPAPVVVAVSQSRDDAGLRTSPVKPPLSREMMTRRFVQYHNELLRRRRWQQQQQRQQQDTGLLSNMFRSFTDMFG